MYLNRIRFFDRRAQYTACFYVACTGDAAGAESARLMLFAAQQLRRAATGAVFRPGARPKGKKRAQLRVLQGLPGIGKKRAEHLLECFGTVEAVMAADVKELTAAAGIGRDTAAAIRWAVGEAAETWGE